MHLCFMKMIQWVQKQSIIGLLCSQLFSEADVQGSNYYLSIPPMLPIPVHAHMPHMVNERVNLHVSYIILFHEMAKKL